MWADGKGVGLTTPPRLGKLGLKDEPGKVRVFAMVDPLTQWLLKPLHEAIFKVLSEIREDATFDQESGVRRMQDLLSCRPAWDR